MFDKNKLVIIPFPNSSMRSFIFIKGKKNWTGRKIINFFKQISARTSLVISYPISNVISGSGEWASSQILLYCGMGGTGMCLRKIHIRHSLNPWDAPFTMVIVKYFTVVNDQMWYWKLKDLEGLMVRIREYPEQLGIQTSQWVQK